MSMTAFVKQLEDKGRNGDTILAHINPEEAQLLKDHGGSGTINPETGIMEFGFFSDLWSGFKSVVKSIAPVIIPAIAIFYPPLIPAIGTALGASGAAAGIVGAAALSAGVTLASGGSLKDVLTSAALAGASAYLTPIAGKMITPAGSSLLTQTMAGTALMGAGYTALRGGTVKEMLAAAATGAASAYIGNVAKDAVAKMNNMMASGTSNTISQKGATDAVFAGADAANLKAAGMTEQQISKTLQGTGMDALTADYAASMAARGDSADTIAANLAANKTNGIYNGEANTKSITAGNNSNLVQKIEDANFVAKDAAQLKAQGLSQAAIVQNLVASGVDVNTANYVASQAMTGLNETQLADKLVNSTGFISSGKVYTSEDVSGRQLGQVMTNEQKLAVAAAPFKSQVDAGLLTVQEAGVLGQQGVTPTQLDSLTKLGYTANDVSDMIGAGNSVQTLTNLANTKFSESQINDLLMRGVSANDISYASSAINSYKNLSVDEAYNLLNQGKSGTSITQMASLGKLPSQTIVQPAQPTQTVPQTIDQQIANTGLVNATDAKILANAGYTQADVQNLINTGYQASDLVDLASTGIPASTLTNLASSPIPESTISQLLEKGVSANDIANASTLINNNTLSTDQVTNLLDQGLKTNEINLYAENYQHQQLKTNLEQSQQTISKFMPEDIKMAIKYEQDPASWLAKVTGQDVQSAQTAIDAYNKSPEVYKEVYSQATTGQQPGLTSIGNGLYTNSNGQVVRPGTNFNELIADSYEQYLAQNQQPTTPEVTKPVTPVQPQQANFVDTGIIKPSNQLGNVEWSGEHGGSYVTDKGYYAYEGPGQWRYFEQVQSPVQPPNTVNVGGGNFMDQYGNIVDSQGNITKAAIQPSQPVQQTATGYTPEQEARYNQLISQGMTPADAVRMIETPGATTTDVQVSGTAGLKGNESVVVPEYRTPNTELATQEQIDNGTAKYNAGANAWEVPTQQTQEPFVPVITPPVEISQPVQPPVIEQPVVTPPVTQQPIQPPVIEQPVVPTQPTTPTVVSSSQYTGTDGSVYQQNTMSDGTTNTTRISGPTQVVGPVQPPVVTPPEQPLSPPVQEIIPEQPKIPEVVVPETPVEPPVEPPVDTTPYVPILTPQPDLGTPGVRRGVARIGPTPTINIPQGLNPGFITNVPQFYQTTNPAQSQYYWGAHPFQPGPTFNPTLYNQVPNAPQTPFGLGYAQGPATGQQIINAMRGVYPYNTNVAGPVRP